MSLASSVEKRPSAAKKFLEIYGLLAALVALIVFFASNEPNFVDPFNITAMLRAAAVTFIMVCGLTWIVATGNIDVSFYATAALANVVSASLVQAGFDWTFAFAVVALLAIVIGLVNGYLVNYMGLSALVVTICSASFLASTALILSSGSSFGIERPGWLFEFIHSTTGDLFAASDDDVGSNLLGSVPLVMWVALIVLFATWYMQERLTFGHYIYAQEGNYEAVHEAGVDVRRLNLLLFVFSTLMAAVAGVLIAAEFKTGQPTMGSSYFVDGLTAVFLGSLVLRAGQANVLGTMVGILILVVIGKGAAAMGWLANEGIGEMIKGGILLLGTGLAVLSQSKKRNASQEV